MHSEKANFAIIAFSYEASTVNRQMKCRDMQYLSIPGWFLYVPPVVRLLQVFNAAMNFPIYFTMGTAFRTAFYNMIGKK